MDKKDKNSRQSGTTEPVKQAITQEHDKGYKSIFSKQRNFLHFLKKYIQVEWVSNIDEKDLILINTTFIDEEYQNKESDVIYKLKFKDSEIIFYILLELQSTVDRTMPFRLLKYMTELMKREFDNTLKNEREATNYRLPAVVPIILYNGFDNWTVLRSFKEYVQGYEQFGEYIIDFKYFLFDLNRMTEETILSTNQLLDMIFVLDQTPNKKNIERMLRIAFENLEGMNDDDRNDILGWIKYIYLNYIPDETIKTEILHKFERGDITNMMYGMDMYVEKKLKKAEARVEAKANKEKLEIAKSLLDVLDVETIAKKFNITVKEVEALKKGK